MTWRGAIVAHRIRICVAVREFTDQGELSVLWLVWEWARGWFCYFWHQVQLSSDMNLKTKYTTNGEWQHLFMLAGRRFRTRRKPAGDRRPRNPPMPGVTRGRSRQSSLAAVPCLSVWTNPRRTAL
jgi:hypothetical protein